MVIRNLGEGPALDCVYVLLLTDPFGLKAWYMTVPTDLAAHESQQFALGPTHGIEQVSFTVSDDTTYSAGQRQRRYHDVFTRAFDNDPRAANVTWSSRALLGLQTPSEDLFQPTDGSSQAESSRDEALIFRCRNRHLHRTLPHVDSEPERVDPNDTTLAWIDWYRQIGRRGLPPPPETSTPKPEARFLRSEPV